MKRVIGGVVGVLGLGVAGIALFACSETSQQPLEAGIGPQPTLVEPDPRLLPTVNIAPAIGWSAGQMPTPASGLVVRPFASGLDHPRNILVLPNGDVLVAESNAPHRPDDGPGLRGTVMRRVMARAGAGVPSASRIILLRDADGDGVAETRSILLQGLSSPYGMALIGETLYVADTDAIRRYRYTSGMTEITEAGTLLTELPGGRINHHWTKNLIASPDGQRLYVGIGSNSNVAENGLEAEEGRAQIWEVDPVSGAHRAYATGLRNPNGLAFAGKMLWTAVNERDEIGSDLVPDYMTSVREGGFYGWPFSYFSHHVDVRVQPPRPEMVARAIVPDYALGAHTASLGLAITERSGLPAPFEAGAFIGQHGSWNRRPASGYRVIFVPFQEGRPQGQPAEVLTAFLDDDGRARGRPVGVAPDGRGGLLVADDVGNTVWRVSAAAR